ncbi:MAG: hypothetical protein NTW29_04340 [Bacteroidetes bacterium]|nr:hypothetical protein [Bacteroidota bacterium]
MMGFGDDLLLIYRNGFKTEQEYEEEVKAISHLLRMTWTLDNFCISHELLDHYRITSKRILIERELKQGSHRPFRFFINKN